MSESNRVWRWIAVVAGAILAGCAGEPLVDPPIECSGTIEITVTGDTIPTFSWTPECTIGRLIVEEGVEERWGTETTGANTYQSPIVYGVHPPNSSKEEKPQPLFLDTEYTVSAWRFFSVDPESLQLLGSQTFTPTAE
jgi:hypothetical protein